MTVAQPAGLRPEAAGLPDQAVLGVEHSICGRRWRARGGDTRAGMALAQRFGLPEIVGRLLAARGVGTEDVETFLAPTLRALLPDPSVLTDMDRGAERLARAVTRGERIAVFGDYDVDGATSSALLWRFFRAAGADVTIYIPDRLREGYGPTAAALHCARRGSTSSSRSIAASPRSSRWRRRGRQGSTSSSSITTKPSRACLRQWR
jgi:hypothetical protein